MLKLDSNLSFYSAYFDGFQDILNFRSCKEVGKGILKVTSLVTWVIPIFVLLKMNKLTSELDALKTLNLKVKRVINNEENENLSQNELVKFLVTYVQDKSTNSEEKLFGNAFKRLETNSQKAFFTQISKEGQLDKALDYIPKDVTKLAFGPADCTNWCYNCKDNDKTDSLVLLFATALSQFPNLEEVEYDLSKITYYTESIKKIFDLDEKSIIFLDFTNYVGLETIVINRPEYSTYRRHTHASTAKEAIRKSALYRRNINPNVKFSFKFKNIEEQVIEKII